MNRKQNVGEAFPVWAASVKREGFSSMDCCSKTETARNVPGGSWVPWTASGAQTEFIR